MQNRNNADDQILESFLSIPPTNEDKKFENAITTFTGEFDLGNALSQAEQGNHYALAQLGKFHYEKGDKERAWKYFDTAIKRDSGKGKSHHYNLAYLIASYLPEDDPKKDEYNLLGIQKRILLYKGAPFKEYSASYEHTNERRSVAAITSVLRNTNRKKSNFVSLMLTILSNAELNNNPYQYMFGLNDALRNAGYEPSKKVGITKISSIETIYPHPYYVTAKEELFALIENYPHDFQDIICQLSQSDIQKIIQHYPTSQANSGQPKEKNPALEFYGPTFFYDYQKKIADEICMYMITHPNADIEKAKKHIFKIHPYHQDYLNGIDPIVQNKIEIYKNEHSKSEKEMAETLDKTNATAGLMITELEKTVHTAIDALERKLNLEPHNNNSTDETTDTIEKKQKKINKNQQILQLQLNAFLSLRTQLEPTPTPSAPLLAPSAGASENPPPYSANEGKSNFKRIQIIAELIKTQNEIVTKGSNELHREPVEWLQGIALFILSMPALIIPVMLLSKKYLHTYKFWDLNAIAANSNEAKGFSSNLMLNETTKHVSKETKKIKQQKETHESLFFSARKSPDEPPPSYEQQEHNASANKKN